MGSDVSEASARRRGLWLLAGIASVLALMQILGGPYITAWHLGAIASCFVLVVVPNAWWQKNWLSKAVCLVIAIAAFLSGIGIYARWGSPL